MDYQSKPQTYWEEIPLPEQEDLLRQLLQSKGFHLAVYLAKQKLKTDKALRGKELETNILYNRSQQDGIDLLYETASAVVAMAEQEKDPNEYRPA